MRRQRRRRRGATRSAAAAARTRRLAATTATRAGRTTAAANAAYGAEGDARRCVGERVCESACVHAVLLQWKHSSRGCALPRLAHDMNFEWAQGARLRIVAAVVRR